MKSGEFSFQSRSKTIQRFREEIFDILIIGGGITGAAVARDATSRGLKVALVERQDFAYGTSSRSSKLIHGGLRYLQNLEMGLVFEALSERALLLKTAPHMVRPLPFYFPVYRGDPHGKSLLGVGMWLYDLLALFRTPEFHRSFSKNKLLAEIPFLRAEGLLGGFRYYDASMWDDALTVETLRAAQLNGAAVANYVEALNPIWKGNQIFGFRVRDREDASLRNEFEIQALRTVICAGPWTDEVGPKLSNQWERWLKPSKGVHLIFSLSRIPIRGAMVMTHPEDGRIAFVIPRPDYGDGVVIVGTTDGPTPDNPDEAEISQGDVDYLMGLLGRYFPELKLTREDILSAYVGVRPLMDSVPGASNAGQKSASSSVLQKVSREHHIDRGPGGTVVVAGGKYTTHRKMAEEIVDFTLTNWQRDASQHGVPAFPHTIQRPQTRNPVNPAATIEAIESCKEMAKKRNIQIPQELFNRYGADALKIFDIHTQGTEEGIKGSSLEDPAGFPLLAAQLKNSIRSEMVLHLEDFYLRRIPLYAARKDHGLPWAKMLSQIWAEERGLSAKEANLELERLQKELAKRSAWASEAPSMR